MRARLGSPMIALLTLLACSTGTVSGTPGKPSADDSDAAADDSAPVADDTADASDDTDGAGSLPAEDDEVEEIGDAVETWPKACADIYDQDLLPTFDLSFTDDAWRKLQSACTSYSLAYQDVTFSYGDESVAAQVRLKGNWSWSCDKYQFVISFNEVDPDARWHGLRKMVLDAPWYDRTLLHERVAFPLFERLGLPYSCANNARVTVNGAFYGVYANVERIDHEYLERNFEDPDGNLYQGGTELKTNEDIGDTSRLSALNSARTVDDIAALVDLDQAVAEWAAEAMLPAMDNYWAGVEINYYLYDHPEQGFLWLPYDLDISFGDSAYVGGGPVWPNAVNADPITYEHTGWRKEALFKTVLADTTWCERFVEELERAREAYDPASMAVDVQTWAEQIYNAVDEDKRKPYTTVQHESAVEDLQEFFQDRADVVDAWLASGGHCPARW